MQSLVKTGVDGSARDVFPSGLAIIAVRIHSGLEELSTGRVFVAMHAVLE